MEIYTLLSLRQLRDLVKFVEEKAMRNYGYLATEETVTISGEVTLEEKYEVEGQKQLSFKTWNLM